MGLHIRTYEGRVLDRQNEDLEDQGLHFDIGTIRNRVSRRKFFGLLGVGAGTAAIAACSPGSDPSAASSATSSSTGTTSGAAASTANSDVDLTEMNTKPQALIPAMDQMGLTYWKRWASKDPTSDPASAAGQQLPVCR